MYPLGSSLLSNKLDNYLQVKNLQKNHNKKTVKKLLNFASFTSRKLFRWDNKAFLCYRVNKQFLEKQPELGQKIC